MNKLSDLLHCGHQDWPNPVPDDFHGLKWLSVVSHKPRPSEKPKSPAHPGDFQLQQPQAALKATGGCFLGSRILAGFLTQIPTLPHRHLTSLA